MRALVEGTRVAVVGPAATQEQLGELTDSYDVVVRTNLRAPIPAEDAPRSGARTDPAYYSGLDLMRHRTEVQHLVEQEHLRLAVTRPHCLPGFAEEGPWLRPAAMEYGLYFRGAALGILRMLYDLLQFSPAEVALFHADFYAGKEATAAGYRDGATAFGLMPRPMTSWSCMTSPSSSGRSPGRRPPV